MKFTSTPHSVLYIIATDIPRWLFQYPVRLIIGACVVTAVIIALLHYRSPASLQSLLDVGQSHDIRASGAVRTGGPTLYVVTPTYRRSTQAADLVRVSQALLLAQVRIFWIIVENADKPSKLVHDTLHRSALPGVQLVARTPVEYRNPEKGRGVRQRLKALAWLRANATLPGVLYFADDDNAYDHRIFSQMMQVCRVGVFPVGLIKGFGLSAPVVSSQGRVVGFHDVYQPAHRRFPMDMAGFAVNLRLVLSAQDPQMPHKAGMLETEFLSSLGVELDDLEPLAENCTEVLVWHTKTVRGTFPKKILIRDEKNLLNTNIPLLYNNILGE